MDELGAAQIDTFELLGQKAMSSVAPRKKVKSYRESLEESKKLNMEDNKKGEKSSPPAPKQQKGARIAPEWDGINCFETIVSY